MAWDFRDFSPFAAVLLDLDGTIFHGDVALPGAAELVRRLVKERRAFACLSNSTTSPMRLIQRLTGMGMEIQADQIYTACTAAADYVTQHWPRPWVFNLATQGLVDVLEGKVNWANHADDPCDVVVCGTMTGEFVTEPRMRTALTILRHGGATQTKAKLLGMCADRVYPSPRGLEFGSGALTTMLSYASDIAPVFTGKPERVFFDELCGRLGVEAQKCLLIGDNLESDIRGASQVGMRTLLVLTGVTRREDLSGVQEELRPDGVIGGLEELS